MHVCVEYVGTYGEYFVVYLLGPRRGTMLKGILLIWFVYSASLHCSCSLGMHIEYTLAQSDQVLAIQIILNLLLKGCFPNSPR